MTKRGRPQQFDKRVLVPLTQRQHDALTAAATLAGVPLNEVMRRALDAYLSTNNKKEAA
jgi:predicted HTH domain antitoxin